jgi:uncharacterized membrane protein YfcA
MPHVTNVLLCLAAFAAGAVNSLAGGGTLLTFPVLLTVMSPVEANATSTVALMPGSAAAAWGYRRELRGTGGWLRLLGPPCILGGLIGTILVVWLPESVFSFAVPWLILTASLLFLFQPLFGRLVRRQPTERSEITTPSEGVGYQLPAESSPGPGTRLAVAAFQLAVAVYGGYFGAGIGILMLTSLSFICPADIHRMNALKTLLAACINGTSVLVFVAGGKVVWHYGLLMAGAGIAGGYCGAHFGRRLPKAVVRWLVILIGLSIAAYQFAKQLTPVPTEPSRSPAVSAIELHSGGEHPST